MQAQQMPPKSCAEAATRTEREGIVAWDQKGLVVVWPDGHCSRFLWATLRHSCHCPECHKQREGQEAI
jgi:DUF971 family protein